MKNILRVGIIHAYPNKYILDSLLNLNIRVVFFGPCKADFCHEILENTIQCPIYDWSQLERIIIEYHQANTLNALLPIYEGAVEITAIIAKKIGLFGIDINSARSSRNKFLSLYCWQKNNLPIPKTIDITNDQNAVNHIKDTIGYPAILKLTDSMNSQGVILVKSNYECHNALAEINNLIKRPQKINNTIDRNRSAYARSDIKIIAQEFCNGLEVSVDVLCNNWYHVVGIFEKSLSSGPYFAETMSIYPTSLDKQREAELGKLAIEALKSLGYSRGIAHVEIRYSENGRPKLIEAGLRPGGAYTVMAIEHLLNINLYRMLVNIYLNINIEPLEQLDKINKSALYGGIVYNQSGTLKKIVGTEVFKQINELLDFKILNQVGDLVFSLPYSAQPHFCYYLLGGGSNRNQLIAKHELINNNICLEIVS
jgi:biotin carboxylase